MMADEFTGLLSEYLDDEDLTPSERSRIAAHLEGCGNCRTTLSDLQAVSARAGSLQDRPPSADLWSGIETRIRASAPSTLPFRAAPRVTRRISFTVPQLVAACLALMVLSGGTVWLARMGGPRTDFEPISAQVSETPVADAEWAATVADLERVMADGRGRLSPETVQALETNLLEIDRAIAQCRAALAADPASVYLNAHLASAQRRKLTVLRRAAVLISARS